MLQVFGPCSSRLGLWGPSGKPREPVLPSPHSHLQRQPWSCRSCRKAVRGEVRRGTCPSGTPDFGSGSREIKKRDGASMGGRRLKPRSGQKLREAAKWARTAIGQLQGRGSHLSPCLLSRVLPALMPDGVKDLDKLPGSATP